MMKHKSDPLPNHYNEAVSGHKLHENEASKKPS